MSEKIEKDLVEKGKKERLNKKHCHNVWSRIEGGIDRKERDKKEEKI